MLSIIRMLLFFLGVFGYSQFFVEGLGVHKRLKWLFTFSVQTLVLYLSSLVGLLKPTPYLLLLLGIILALVYGVKRSRQGFHGVKIDPIALGMLVYLLVFGITLWNSPLLHYDNFTHWGTIVKFLHINDVLPTQADKIISYFDYPVGSSLFIYFFTTIVGFSDGSMLVGQFILILSGLYAMFAALRDERRMLMASMLFASFAMFNYLNIAIRLNNLLVDFLLAVLLLGAVAGFFAYKDRFGLLTLHTVSVLGLLSIVKTSGLFFVAIGLVLYMGLSVRLLYRKDIGLGLFLWAPFASLASLAPYLLWKRHVAMNFTNASEAKHAVSSGDILSVLSGDMTELAQTITQKFIQSFLDLQTLSTQAILFINLICILALVILGGVLKRPKGRLLFTWLFSNLTILVYYIGIWLMYLVAMPADEAVVLAGLERYTSSIVIFVLGMVMMVLVREMDYALFEQNFQKRTIVSYSSLFTKRLYQNTSLALMFLTVGMLLSENNGIHYNNRTSNHISSQKIKDLVGDNTETIPGKILVVSTDKENIENYFIQHSSRYYLYSSRYYSWNAEVDGREDFLLSDEEFKALLENYDKILVLDDHYTFNAMMQKVFGKVLKPGLYSVSELEKE